jgi:hypothetical protein
LPQTNGNQRSSWCLFLRSKVITTVDQAKLGGVWFIVVNK